MKILWISDAIDLKTGLGNQGLTITTGLAKRGHQIVTLGWGSDTEKRHHDIPIYPLYGSFSNGVSLILKQYYAFDPDIIISYGDIHTVQHMIVDIRDSRFKNRWVHWLPVDGDPYPEHQDALYQELRHLVLASKFGEDVFRNNYKGDMRMIYNAIEPEEFFPTKDAVKPKEFENKFVCLFVGMNQIRKKIPLLLDGFAKFSKGKEDAILVLHTQPHSMKAAFQGWDLPQLIKAHGLSNVLISSDIISRSKLNKLYNCSNVMVSATGGEGFNLPAAEAMMAGLPLLLPDFTTGQEFIGQDEDRCGEVIRIAEYVHESPLNIRKAVISTDDFANKLNQLYLDWKNGGHNLAHMSKNAVARAQSMFRTDSVLDQWEATIKDVSKQNAIRQINLTKSFRNQKKVIIIDDLDPGQWIGGTQLSTKKILDTASSFGFDAKCVTINNCDLADLYSADLVVLNNIHETILRSPGLISEIVSNLSYVKWEHDFNFCSTRDFRCGGAKEECQTDCGKTLYAEVYNNAKALIFQSPLHHQAFLKRFGEKIVKNVLILPPPIDPDPFTSVAGNPARENRFLWTGLMHPFRGIEEAIKYAEDNPQRKFLFHSAYPPAKKDYEERIRALSNCELRIEPLTYEQMPKLFASCSDLLYQPRYIDASSRTCLEALLAGCRLRPNQNVGLMSYDWDWTNKASVIEKIKSAPKLFWEHINKALPETDHQPKITAAKLNIVFFPSGTNSGEHHLPSSHIRVYTVADILQKMGYNVQVVDPDLPDEMKYSILSSLRSNDIVYVQKTYSKFNRAVNFKHIKGNNVIVYDVDDFYEERNNKGSIQYMHNSDEMAMLADLVIVGSHRLQQWNSKNNKNVKIIASLVDDSLYTYKPREVKEPHQIKILWTEKDGRIYVDDLMMVKDVLDEIHRKYGCQLILQSFISDEIKDIQDLFPYAKILPVVNFREYVNRRIPLMQECDFFIAPFSPTAFRNVEKQYKAGQNSRHIMGLGVPGIATPTGEHDFFIEDGVNGFLAKTKQEWFDRIEQLATDSALRIQMGVKSRETIDKNYTVDKTIRHFLEAIHSIKNKYYNPTIEVTRSSQFKALVTIKDGSSGGGTLTSRHIRDILENIGYKTQLVYCNPLRGSAANYVYQIDGQRLKQPMLLREYAKKYPVDVIYFDDVSRYDKDAAMTASKSYLILCGCANVHEEYYTNPIVLGGARGIDRVFVKNYALWKFLNSMYGDRFVFWQGGIDGQKMRTRYGRAIYRHPKDGVLLTSSFSDGWWKNPTIASMSAFAIWRKYPKTKYFKPILRPEDVEFSKHSHFKIMGNREAMPREELLATIVQSQLGLEVYLADAFPRTLLDYFAMGVPLITSDALTFLNDFPILYENIVVQNPNDPLSVYHKALALLEDQEKWETVSAACIEFTKQYSFQAESDVLLKYSQLQLPEGMAIPRLESANMFLQQEEL